VTQDRGQTKQLYLAATLLLAYTPWVTHVMMETVVLILIFVMVLVAALVATDARLPLLVLKSLVHLLLVFAK